MSRNYSDFEVWSKIARTRSRQIEDYIDITFHEVFLPRYYEIFRERMSEIAVDVGAGTGHLALHLRNFVQKLVAIEPSYGMYEVAKETLFTKGVEVKNVSSFDYKPNEKFDCAYSHMCVHTVENIENFFTSISRILKKSGEFIFLIPHPCFYYKYKNYFLEEYDYMDEKVKCVDLTISSDQKNVMPGIPYFHRPLSRYFESLKNAGFLVSDLIEEWPSSAIQKKYPEPWEAPRYCTFICVLK